MVNPKPYVCLLSSIINYYLGVRSIFIFIYAMCWTYFILCILEKKNTFRNQRPSLGFIVIKDLTSKSKILLRRSTNIFYSCGEFFNTTILFNFIFENIINTDKNPLSIEILDFYITMSFIYSFTILPVHIMYMSSC